MSEPLWRPSARRIESANLTAFMRALEQEGGGPFADYDALWRYSVDEIPAFWDFVWRWCAVIGERPGKTVLADADRMPGARFFPQARLNYAENLLRPRPPGSTAIVFRGEDKVRREMSFAEVEAAVSRFAQALAAEGVGEGDRVAGYLPNMPETAIAMMAAAALGAVWSSCSPDFGVQGVLDRFGQIEPKVLVAVDGYHYNGKTHDCRAKTAEIAGRLPSLSKVVVVSYAEETPDVSAIPAAVRWDEFVAEFDSGPIAYRRVPFNAPLYILFSSGTTGVPKCMVHGVGGTLLKHLVEQKLHSDVRPGDKVFYFTTCGWMMWNWLVSALACEATLVLYDGSPFHPLGNVLFDYADEVGVTLFGTSAKFIDAAKNADLAPVRTHDLGTVRTLCSTGSPLVAESFDYVYEKVKRDVHLASISGGTDICGCFVLGNPIGPVWRGEIQARGLGMAVDVYDDEGRSIVGEKGELVCTRPFPSMPVSFWNDPDGAKYRAAYFERFPGIWCHGDYVELTPHGGMVIYGRSDAVLNPGGVRIGTAEIYRQVEQLDEVVEGLVIGQEWERDVRVVLFVVLKPGLSLDEDLTARIRQQIRRNTTPRHVPAKVVQVSEIPRTKSNKIVELAVREVVHGRPVKNIEALANPEALEHFRDRAELRD